MMPQEKIKQEIAFILDSMKTADNSQREYLIGQLSALLWVQAGGDMLRPVAFMQAVTAWDTMREDSQRDPKP